MDASYGHFLELARIQSEVNKLFDVLLQSQGAEGEGELRWLPNVDVCETPDAIMVRCELPGVGRDALRLTAQGTALVICGDKEGGQEGGRIKYHCRERASGTFRRVVHLPPLVNTRGARASLANGLLTISFPKVSNRRGEEVVIPVEHEESEETVGAS